MHKKFRYFSLLKNNQFQLYFLLNCFLRIHISEIHSVFHYTSISTNQVFLIVTQLTALLF